MQSFVQILVRINGYMALAAGTLLLVAVIVILADVAMRAFGHPLGGTDELSGYAMAIATAWGASYALTERAHVRIELIRNKLVPAGRAWMDLISLGALAITAVVIGWRGWGVLASTLANDSRANTALATPLAWPQTLWFAGWLWFAVSALLLLISVMAFMFERDWTAVEDAAGFKGEL
ncbi:TRAP transporter small permease [Yoonia sp. BS5-3]|uniref:TRAP transporter small permease protein n=1 Tax=Yoonia phaeophyticola TaxID=3137369 RepID=A0ABZ2V2A9_9RHOB